VSLGKDAVEHHWTIDDQFSVQWLLLWLGLKSGEDFGGLLRNIPSFDHTRRQRHIASNFPYLRNK
jgi:hypothetical protein